MSKYINADAVIIKYRGGFHDDYVVDYDSFIKAPSIDITFCKDCSHTVNRESKVPNMKYCGMHCAWVLENCFCAWGDENE